MYEFTLSAPIKLLQTSEQRERHVSSFIKDLQTQTTHQSFRSIARMQRNIPGNRHQQAPRVFATLMDPGAELNLIRADLIEGGGKNSELRVHARQPDVLILMNNGKEVARVEEAVYLSFVLDSVDGVARQTYHEWFHVLPNMDEELLLGAEFCKQQGFTNFHTRLQPWHIRLAHPKTRHLAQFNSLEQVEEQDDVEPLYEILEREPRPDTDGWGFDTGFTNANALQTAIDAQRVPDELQPLLRQPSKPRIPARDRVVTICEQLDEHAIKFAESKESKRERECEKIGGRRVRNRNTLTNIPPAPKSHSNHVPVQYNPVQSRQVASLLARRVIDEQKQLHKTLKHLTASEATLTMEEAEIMRDTARMCAREAADFYEKNEALLRANSSSDFAASGRSSK